MKFTDLSTQMGEITDVLSLPEEVRSIISETVNIPVINYPLSDTNGLIISPTLDWDMGDENINRSIINLDSIISVGVFGGPSCDIYKKIDEDKISWIYYECSSNTLLIKI